MTKRRTPSADLHTPEELLAVAASLLDSGDPTVRRAVVLEAITALEAFVQRTVFGLLDDMLDPLLVRWIEERSRMDFDARLSTLTSVALGKRVDTSSSLWSQYKRAKTIRNRVTHTGSRVSHEDAAFVLETVREWLAYLGSTAEVTLALQGLRGQVESGRLHVVDTRSAIAAVQRYFSATPASVTLDAAPLGPSRRVDVLLRYDAYTVVVEVKIIPPAAGDLEAWISAAVGQVVDYVAVTESSRGAVVIFSQGPVPEAYRGVRIRADGLVSVVVIRVPDLRAG